MIELATACLLAAFAVYRVARMAAIEEGPGAVFLDFRNFFLKDDWIGRGFRCPLCLGWWFSLIPALVIANTLPVPWWSVFGLWPAIAGAQAFLWDLVPDASK